MSEQEVENTEQVEQEQQAADEPNEAAEGDTEESKTYSEDYVKRLRNENAQWRTQLREAQEKLGAAKSPEDYEALATKLADVQRRYDLDAVKAKETKGLPEELIDSVTWPDDEDAIKAQASALAKFAESIVVKPSSELHGGIDPKSARSAPNQSPEQLARRYNKRVAQG